MTKLLVRARDLFVCQDCLFYIAYGDEPEEPNGWQPPDIDLALVVCSDSSDQDKEFSWSDCDLCDSSLGGSRHHCVQLAELDVTPYTRAEYDAMLAAYKECALWASAADCPKCEGERDDCEICGGRGDVEGLEGFALAAETRATMHDELADWLASLPDMLRVEMHARMEPSQVGHDFWLTRNGHGAGFWDRGYGPLGNRLTETCKSCGSRDLYLDDNGEVYQQ